MTSTDDALLGGIRQTHSTWVGRTLQVRFQTLHTDRLHQIYAGREKVGQTSAIGERLIIARVRPSTFPPQLTMVAVRPAVANQDFGDQLPERAFNRVSLRFDATGGSWANAQVIRAITGDAPGDPISDVELARMVFEHEGENRLFTKPLKGSGHWPIRIEGIDNSPGGGNTGTAAETVVRVTAHPPDLVPVSSSRRFTVEVAGGVATIECEVPA